MMDTFVQSFSEKIEYVEYAIITLVQVGSWLLNAKTRSRNSFGNFVALLFAIMCMHYFDERSYINCKSTITIALLSKFNSYCTIWARYSVVATNVIRFCVGKMICDAFGFDLLKYVTEIMTASAAAAAGG